MEFLEMTNSSIHRWQVYFLSKQIMREKENKRDAFKFSWKNSFMNSNNFWAGWLGLMCLHVLPVRSVCPAVAYAAYVSLSAETASLAFYTCSGSKCCSCW